MRKTRMTQAARTSNPFSLGDTPIRSLMSASPACIASHRTLADAWSAMHHAHVRHLPVLEGGIVVGMISQRDLGLLGTHGTMKLADVRVDEAMSSDPYVVSSETSLRSVIATMAARRIGSAIIVDRGGVQGVFTTTDAITALQELLEGAASAA